MIGGKLNSVQVHVSVKHPFAAYIHCGVYSLNSASSDAFSTVPTRNCMTVVSKRFLKICSSMAITARASE